MVIVAMNRDEFNAKAKQLQAQGFTLTGDEGNLSKEGVSVDYVFDGSTLSLTVKHKPMIVTLGYCETKIREWLTS